MLDSGLSDNVKATQLMPDGTYQPYGGGRVGYHSQAALYEQARQAAAQRPVPEAPRKLPFRRRPRPES